MLLPGLAWPQAFASFAVLRIEETRSFCCGTFGNTLASAHFANTLLLELAPEAGSHEALMGHDDDKDSSLPGLAIITSCRPFYLLFKVQQGQIAP